MENHFKARPRVGRGVAHHVRDPPPTLPFHDVSPLVPVPGQGRAVSDDDAGEASGTRTKLCTQVCGSSSNEYAQSHEYYLHRPTSIPPTPLHTTPVCPPFIPPSQTSRDLPRSCSTRREGGWRVEGGGWGVEVGVRRGTSPPLLLSPLSPHPQSLGQPLLAQF